MNGRESFMYKILANISETEEPIVFKGALITKLILAENGFAAIDRATRDIDANWVGAPPSMSALTEAINRSFGELASSIEAFPIREYGESRAAGFSIKDKKTGAELLSMDVDIKPLAGDSRIYYCGNLAVKGVLANEILTDKISACSSDIVYKWRTKDIVDVYALSQCVEVNVKDIFETSTAAKRTIGAFDGFYNKKAELKHSYEKLEGVTGKPEFETIYSYLGKFFKPFMEQNRTVAVWDSDKAVWNEPKALSMNDWMRLIHREKEKEPKVPEYKTKSKNGLDRG